MRKLLYISLIALAGCTTSLSPEPQPVVTGTSISSYFWPDSTVTYTYTSTGGDNHTVSISAGGEMLDNNLTLGTNTSLHISWANGSDALSGFSHSDLFGLDSSLQIVADTAMPPQTHIGIVSIAAVNVQIGFTVSGKLFAASSDSLYQIVQPGNKLINPFKLPASGLSLAEDVNTSNNALYAFQKGGNEVWRTTNDGFSWSSYTTAPGITAFASDPGRIGNLFWVACGSQLYVFSNTSVDTIIAAPLGTITALEADIDDGILAADNSGLIFDFSHTGKLGPNLNIGSPVRGLVSDFVSTQSGVFNFTDSKKIVNNNDSALYATTNTIYAARYDGSGMVDYFANSTQTNPATFPAPVPGATVTQFAYPGLSNPNGTGVYALVGSQVFYLQSPTAWDPVNQVIAAPPFQPGSLTLLDSSSAWVAGFVERILPDTAQRGYVYYATSSGPFKTLNLNGTTYNDVLIVSYTSKANGVTDTTGVTQFNIYYEKGIGPVVIERSWNGSVVTTVLKQ